jgi:hypothetical protein
MAGRISVQDTAVAGRRSVPSSWLQVTFGLLALLAVIGGVVSIAFNHIVSVTDSSDYSWSDPINQRKNVAALGTYLAIACFVLLLVWAFKAHRATDALRPVGRTWRTGWVIGSWFIPVFNLVGPQLVLSEIDRIARSDRTPHGVGLPWRRTRANPIGWSWWILLVVGGLLQVIGSAVESSATSEGNERTAYVLYSAGFVCWAASSVFGLFYVRGVSARLDTDPAVPVPALTPSSALAPSSSAPSRAEAAAVHTTLDSPAEEVPLAHEPLTEPGSHDDGAPSFDRASRSDRATFIGAAIVAAALIPAYGFVWWVATHDYSFGATRECGTPWEGGLTAWIAFPAFIGAIVTLVMALKAAAKRRGTRIVALWAVLAVALVALSCFAVYAAETSGAALTYCD